MTNAIIVRSVPYFHVWQKIVQSKLLSPYVALICYHSLIAAKITALELKNNYGTATYNATSKLVVYPEKISSDRMPSNVKRVRGGAAAK